MDAEKRSSMFEAVKEVKKQRSFGTVEAVRYLKDRERYDSLLAVAQKIYQKVGHESDDGDYNLLRSALQFRSSIIFCLLHLEGRNPSRYGRYRAFPELGFQPDEDIFGSEKDYVRSITHMFSEGVRSFVHAVLLSEDVNPSRVTQLWNIFSDLIIEQMDDEDVYERKMVRASIIISYQLFPALISVAISVFLKEALEEEYETHPVMGERSEESLQAFDDLLDELETTDINGEIVSVFKVASYDIRNEMKRGVQAIVAPLHARSDREIEQFFPLEKLYHRFKREQRLHDMWFQRELITSWMEKYPVSEFTIERDIPRIGSFENALYIIDQSIEELRQRRGEHIEDLEDIQEFLDTDEYVRENIPPGPPIDREKYIQKMGEIFDEKVDLELLLFIRLQLIRHRSFVEKFLES